MSIKPLQPTSGLGASGKFGMTVKAAREQRIEAGEVHLKRS